MCPDVSPVWTEEQNIHQLLYTQPGACFGYSVSMCVSVDKKWRGLIATVAIACMCILALKTFRFFFLASPC